nr:retrovirus-related Pol polyprotein from transposon TNT 1-94 [Tanacetum cinerariifolium]
MHNGIMAAGLKDRPLMLVTGRYPQWRSRFLRYIDTRTNGDALRKCIISGPYKPTIVLVQAVAATDDSLVVPEHTTLETPMNMSPANKAHFEAEKEAIHLILTGIGDEIYSTVDACQTAQEIHKGVEIAKPITPPSETDSEEDNNPKQAQRDNDMQKNLALITKTVNVVGARENVGSPLVQQFRIQYTDEEIDEQELEAHYNYMAKIQEVPTADIGTNSEPLEKVQNDTRYNVFSNDLQNSEQSESISNTCLVETDDSNIIPDSPDMCNDDIQNDQNNIESDDKLVALVNLIANLKLDVDEIKKIQKQLKKANTTLAQELKECKTILAETCKTLGESNSVRDSCLVALQNKKTEFEKYKAFNDRTIDYDKLEHKLNETLGQLALKDIKIKEGLKTKAYEIPVVKEKHNELIKQSLLTKSHYEGLVKQKTKVITDLKLREEPDIDKMLSMEKQLKFLNKIVYKRRQSIQTIHMMAPKVPTYNGRPTFANSRYLKQAQSEIPCLYVFPYDQSTHANRLIPDGKETLALERESRSKLNKDLVRPYDYNTLNSLYKNFKPSTQEFEIQLAHANELRKKMWRKSFVKYKPNIFKTTRFLPISKSISKIRQAYNVMTNNINHFKEIVDNAWIKHSKDQFCAPSTQDIEILIQTCLMPLALKTQNDSFIFVHEVKQEIHADLKKTQTRAPQSPQTVRNTNPRVSTSTGVNHKTNVSRPQHRSNQLKDKVMPNNSQVKLKKTQVEEHPRISSISNKTKPVTACSDSLNSRTSNVNVVCATCKKCLVDSDHFACVTQMLNDVNARTKKPNVVLISTRKPKGNLKLLCNFVEKFLGTVRFGNDQFALILGYGDLVQGNVTINRVYYVKCLNHNLFSVGQFCNVDLENRHHQLHSASWLRPHQFKHGYSIDTFSSQFRLHQLAFKEGCRDWSTKAEICAHVPSQQELDLLFGSLYDEFFNAGFNPQDKQPTTNIQPTLAPSTPTYVHAEENNDHQAQEEHLQDDEFTNPFYADQAGCIDTRKSTSGGIKFLGDKLVSWMSKKHDCTVMSSAKGEYVVLPASCAQIMWMRTQLQDYGFNYNKILLYCDSQSAIAISCNPVHHSRTKHIHTRYHFIKEQFKNGIIELYFVRTEYQIADMFTKALPKDRFKYLIRRIGIRCLTLAELEVLAKEST